MNDILRIRAIQLRRRALRVAGVLAACLAVLPASGALAADAWPSRTVKIIVPFPPGGPADGSARVLAEAMAPLLGQAMIVENRAGGGGVVGIGAAAQSKDAHTLLMGSTSMVVTPNFNPNLPYDVVRDFDPIGMVSAQPLVVVVPAASALRSIDDLVKTARAQPGKLTAANSGIGTLAHLAAELFAGRMGVSITSVPYKGESAAMPDLMAGTVSLGFLNKPILLPLLRDGRLRALAVAAPEPDPDLPGVATLRALGYPGLEAEGWAALLATKGIPEDGLAKLESALNQALASALVKQRFASFGVTPVVSGRSKLRDYLKSEGERWGQVIRTRGIKLN